MLKSMLPALFVSLSLVASVSHAAPTPHTWHTVSATDGTWQAKLQFLNESGFFIDGAGNPISDFTISPKQSQRYGFGFDPGSDFNIAYSLTLVKQDGTNQFSSKACVYIVTASGPAQPDIRATSFNDATCNWNVVPGVGEDFTVA